MLVFLFVAGTGLRIISYPPRSTHIWRQSDCLAYTKTYCQRNSGILCPAVYNLSASGGRVALSEFPVLYYLSAKLCGVFGFHYWVIRGVNLFCYIIGLYYLLLCCRLWIKDSFLSLFPVMILASTPLYFYYGINYLPNVPAISFSFAGLYHMLQYRRSDGYRHLVVSTLFFIAASLLKPTDGGIIWIACMAVMLASPVKQNAPKKIWPLLASFATIAACIILWYLFVRNYNARYSPGMNAQGIYPVWSMPSDVAALTFLSRFDEWYWRDFQHLCLLLLMFAFAIIYIVKWKAMDPFLRSFTLLLIAGVLAYSALWFDAFLIHDYYELIYAIPVVFLCITVLEFYSQRVAPRLTSKMQYGIYILALGLVVTSIYHNQARQLEKYDSSNISVNNPAVYEVSPYLRQIGITEADSVLSVPDPTPNVTLAAFGNRGYTPENDGRFNVPYCIAHGIRYLIITDSSYIHKPAYAPYTSKLMGVYQGIYIYDMAPGAK